MAANPAGGSSRERALDEALASHLKDCDAGRTPDRRELAARFPDLASEIEEFFLEQDRANHAFAPLRTVAQAACVNVPTPDAAEPGATTIDDVLASLTGLSFGAPEGYEILEPIASGGMGAVFKARDKKLNRIVALKFILGGPLASSAELQRFRNEAEAAANLDHPNIVPIYEVGESNGQAFFSMKLIEGGSLASRLADFQKDPKQSARLIISIARAAHYAHQHGILHRDLKPANVLLDNAGRPHVTDFGLAKRINQPNAELTQTGALVGTPGYMAPELTDGAAAATTASDLYGIGAILYALLTGHAPFRGSGMLDTLEQVRNQPPEPPGKANRSVPRDLELICLKCLEKEPQRRYAGGEALAQELERFLDGRPLTETRPVGSAERLWRWYRRHPVPATLGATILLLLLAVAIGSTWAGLKYRDISKKEHANFLRAEANLTVAHEAVAYFAKLSNGPQMQKRGLEKMRRDIQGRARDFYTRLTEQQPDEPDLEADRGNAFIELGRILSKLGPPGGAMPVLQQAQQIFDRLTQAYPENPKYEMRLAEALLEQGMLGQLTGQTGEAGDLLNRALGIQQRLVERYPDNIDFQKEMAKGYFQLARLLQITHQPDRARQIYEDALHRFESLAKGHSEPIYQEHLARTHINLGTIYLLPKLSQLLQAPANSEMARQHYAAAQGILESLDQENPEYQGLLAEVFHLIGRMYRIGGRLKESLEPTEKAIGVLTTLTAKYTDGPDYQFRLGIDYHAQGESFLKLNQLDRARTSYDAAARLTESLVREYETPDYQTELGTLEYDRACLEGLAAAALKDPNLEPVERQKQIDQCSAEAIKRLRKSWNIGFLKQPYYFANLKVDPDLNSFRQRDDFKSLLAEFEAKMSKVPGQPIR
jgi:tetratricopeptide (TPR) repeat protein/tRNA A-37 threonylcarbamoyl transferase component Bud32